MGGDSERQLGTAAVTVWWAPPPASSASWATLFCNRWHRPSLFPLNLHCRGGGRYQWDLLTVASRAACNWVKWLSRWVDCWINNLLWRRPSSAASSLVASTMGRDTVKYSDFWVEFSRSPVDTQQNLRKKLFCFTSQCAKISLKKKEKKERLMLLGGFTLQPLRCAGPLGDSSRTFDLRRLRAVSHSRHLPKIKTGYLPGNYMRYTAAHWLHGRGKLLSISSEANMMEADVIFMTQSRATWRRAFQAYLQQEVVLMMPSRATPITTSPSAQYWHWGVSGAAFLSIFVALLILAEATHSDLSLPGEAKFL